MEGFRSAVVPASAEAAVQRLESLARQAGVPSEYAFVAVVATTLVCILIITSLVSWLSGSSGSAKSNKKKGNAVLLLGQSGSGKSCLLYRLFAGTFPECVTSMEANEKPCKIEDGEDGKTVTVIDFPGHARLRGELPTLIRKAACVVLVVDATDTGSKALTEVAELLYDVFTECIRASCEPPMLVACNKCEVKGAASPSTIKEKLEKELDSLKSTRHTLETEGEEGQEIVLGTEGAPFSFENDAGVDVEFESISVKNNQIDSVVDFISSVFL